jgi:hypothetical protein
MNSHQGHIIKLGAALAETEIQARLKKGKNLAIDAIIAE